MGRAERRRLQREQQKQAEQIKKYRAPLKAPYASTEKAHMAGELAASVQQLKQLEAESYADGFEDGQNWSNVINSLAMALALHDLYGFGYKRFLTVVRKANDYIQACDRRDMTVSQMAERVKDTVHIQLHEEERELIDSIGL